jgi:hypothetical protein
MASLHIESTSPQLMHKSHCLANALSYLDKVYGINTIDTGATQQHEQGIQTYLAN